MCIIAILFNPCPDVAIAIAHNRDEFYSREALPIHFWDDKTDLVAGRDVVGGGTWLALRKNGDFAAILNYRDPTLFKKTTQSRGKILLDYLYSESDFVSYIGNDMNFIDEPNPFTIVAGNMKRGKFFAYNSVSRQTMSINNSITVLSNGSLESCWPKQQRLRNLIESANITSSNISDVLFELLADKTRPPDEELPKTGISLEQERIVSSIFVESEVYGTRCSTVVKIDNAGVVSFSEKDQKTGGILIPKTISWNI